VLDRGQPMGGGTRKQQRQRPKNPVTTTTAAEVRARALQDIRVHHRVGKSTMCAFVLSAWAPRRTASRQVPPYLPSDPVLRRLRLVLSSALPSEVLLRNA
jgi:hypothetical protein